MMVLHRAEERIEHRRFAELPEFVHPGDLLVLNDTRVLPSRHFSEDGRIEFLFLERLEPGRWKCMVRPGRRMKPGMRTRVAGVELRVESVCDEGERIVTAEPAADFFETGAIPLPPYLGRAAEPADRERYQTTFARAPGAVAAPTAGLHFTPALLQRLPHAFLTLHVGTGTFRPVQSERIADHRMHAERFLVSEETAEAINAAGRILAIGTTTVRVLETVADERGVIAAGAGETSIFIRPPHEFRAVDMLLTNFHLPGSTLLMLVSALAGREFILRAYEEAVRERYRFFSYGDCMLIL